jgi:ribosomal-protein-alanine N-acetyltransferase
MRFSNGEAPEPGFSSEDVQLASMTEDSLEEVLAIENASFPNPWRREHFLFELHENHVASNLVLEHAGSVVGYACVWIVGDELKINNVAVHPAWRGHGLSRRLLGEVIDQARRRGCTLASLEVRPSNLAARHVYAALGFVEVRRRRGYYQPEGEDAIVMEAELGDGG